MEEIVPPDLKVLTSMGVDGTFDLKRLCLWHGDDFHLSIQSNADDAVQ